MQYWYRGRFSKGLDSITSMSVTFNGREPSEVRDAAAANWFDGHPDYVRVAEEPETVNNVAIMAAALAAKRAAKKPAPKKAPAAKKPAAKPAKAKAKK